MSVIGRIAVVGIIVGIGLSGGCRSESPAADPAQPVENTAGQRVSLPAELLDVSWLLQSYGETGDERPVIGETAPTLLFSANRQVNGTTGCNSFSTTYETDGGSTLSFNAIAMTRMACPDDITDQEYALANAYASIEAFESNGEELMLFYRGGEAVLLFFADESVDEPSDGPED